MRVLPGLVMVAAMGIAAPAFAERGASVGLALSAEAAPFCRVQGADGAVSSDGNIGLVREVCNTGAGYEVRADFTNLSSGIVRADEEVSALDEAGGASFRSSEARRRTRFWAVTNVVPENPAQPITVRFSISPL